ncbi:hypothetical protein PHLCEN_2v659 [Hermanssonia centrifuga]|uniref:Uncharacterized protein n=1 Tax=Hermanssonia centrifuga TaxID=98765 RepID=A0A2R6S5C0_9APHY|nr:hypothetical protein PHLCEN_2v659 [Hermanssonia centrifuga]
MESPSQATLEIHIRPLASLPGTDSRALASTLKAILSPALLLSQHPRTLIQLVGQALCGSDSGSGFGSVGRGWNASLVASLVNASSAALINASSVPMKGTVCAVAVGRLPGLDNTSAPTPVLDPSEKELPYLVGGGCFAFMFSSTLPSAKISQSDTPNASLLWTNYTASRGPLTNGEFTHAQQLAEKAAGQIWKRMKTSVAQRKTKVSVSGLKREKKKAQETSLKAESEGTDEHEDDEKIEI